MSRLTRIVPRWLPALTVMAVTFYFSSQPSTSLPDFGGLDYLVKKSGHAAGYALLALALWHALEWRRDRRWLTWLLTVLYAATDEFHQTFTAGRHPSFWDVAVFDNLGALVSLWLAGWRLGRKK